MLQCGRRLQRDAVTIDALIAAIGIYGGALAIGAISSVLPIVSIEVFLVAVALAQPPSFGGAFALVVLATLGQVLGKLPIYASTRAVASLPGRHQRIIERMRSWVARFGDRPLALIGTSALVGLPPFSLVSTAAGALAIPVRAFCAVIAAGRAARFTILLALTS